MTVRRRFVAFSAVLAVVVVVAAVALLGIPAGVVEAFDPAPDPKWVTTPKAPPESVGPPRPLIAGLGPTQVVDRLEAEGFETHGPVRLHAGGMEWRSVKPGGTVIVTEGPNADGVAEVRATADRKESAAVFAAAARGAGIDPADAVDWLAAGEEQGEIDGLILERSSGGGSMVVLRITPAVAASPEATDAECDPAGATQAASP